MKDSVFVKGVAALHQQEVTKVQWRDIRDISGNKSFKGERSTRGCEAGPSLFTDSQPQNDLSLIFLFQTVSAATRILSPTLE